MFSCKIVYSVLQLSRFHFYNLHLSQPRFWLIIPTQNLSVISSILRNEQPVQSSNRSLCLLIPLVVCCNHRYLVLLTTSSLLSSRGRLVQVQLILHQLALCLATCLNSFSFSHDHSHHFYHFLIAFSFVKQRRVTVISKNRSKKIKNKLHF